MNQFEMPVWVVREGVLLFVARALPELVPMVESMSDAEVIKLSDALAEEFATEEKGPGL